MKISYLKESGELFLFCDIHLIVHYIQLTLGEKKDTMMEELEALVTVPADIQPAVTMTTTADPVTPAPDSQISVESEG